MKEIKIVMEKCHLPLIFTYMEMNLFFEKMYNLLYLGTSSPLRAQSVVASIFTKFGTCCKDKSSKKSQLSA